MYVEDAQTHELPKSSAAKARIALAMRYENWEVLLNQLNMHRKNVQQHFDATFNGKTPLENTAESRVENINEADIWQGVIEEKTALQALTGAGFRDAVQTLSRLQMLRNSNRYQRLPELSRQRFDALMPHAIAQSARMPNPDITLLRVTDVFESICKW